VTSADDERQIEELQSTVQQLRKDLLTTRDALIGAQAESATLKVRIREIEVRRDQVERALATHSRISRVIERITNHRLTRGLSRRVKSLSGLSGLRSQRSDDLT
jgi:septal ring factor EnvC (AmiA/AmiB activator)